MFVDAVGANVLVFAVGQVFAWLFLRTGRFWVGAGATILLWVAIDWWLVQRYLLATPPEGQQLAVLLLQLTALSVTFAFVWARIRQRLGRAERPARFRAAVAELLQGKAKEAEAGFARLAWSDPWDVSAWIGRGDALRRLGAAGKARHCYRRAAGVDTDKAFVDLVAHRMDLLRRATATPAKGRATQTPTAEKKVTPMPTADEPAVKPAARRQKRVRKAASGD